MDRGWGGIGQPWTGIGQSRSAAGAAAVYITFGYHRRPPARTRAAARGRRPDLWGLRLTAGRRQKQRRQPERALVLLLLFTDVGPIWAQVCPCLGPRLLLLLLLLLLLWLLLWLLLVLLLLLLLLLLVWLLLLLFVVGVVVVVVVVVVVLLLLADVGPIWAQVCPCLGPRLAHVAHILA